MSVSLTGETEEPDYEKFEELMAFWETIPRGFPASWHTARETASTLPEGGRTLTAIKDIVSEARRNERKAIISLDILLCRAATADFVPESYLQEFRCIYGQLLGLARPHPMMEITEDVWESEYAPKVSVGETRPGYEWVARIFKLLRLVRGLDCPEVIFIVGVYLNRKFLTYLGGEVYRSWRQKLITDFPELLYRFIGDGMTDLSEQEMKEYKRQELEKIRKRLDEQQPLSI
ncbi:uncharacterized protein TRIVIDRAFT_226520 [Trichoderma virens Gv29-8]|uniref:Uncharacterized protein n=1 Tax=Hypocrea virens (strain Gv29-8 / FGSC 10586) TaxID=413071 RepID=G9N762_HYPVG|nr:uncharacterized protein TRIVIDRAFT_226520 [Trichoderma virens Gv29-8]EHK17560.1 hypothetical protein TRIVIDRAFT_226520 [Trichoderma virens Gv29-8]UKZ53720.1 hypothetical protein TrVGV298_007517 [Trichoderma virens]